MFAICFAISGQLSIKMRRCSLYRFYLNNTYLAFKTFSDHLQCGLENKNRDFKPFQANVPYLRPRKNGTTSNVFRGYRNGLFALIFSFIKTETKRIKCSKMLLKVHRSSKFKQKKFFFERKHSRKDL